MYERRTSPHIFYWIMHHLCIVGHRHASFKNSGLWLNCSTCRRKDSPRFEDEIVWCSCSFFCLWRDLTPHLDLFTSKHRLFASESLGLTYTIYYNIYILRGSIHISTPLNIIFANIFLQFFLQFYIVEYHKNFAVITGSVSRHKNCDRKAPPRPLC